MSKFSRKGKGSAGGSGGSGVRCTGCKGTGWVEWSRTRTVRIQEPVGAGGETFVEKTEVTNQKCGNCDGTGWA